MTVRGIRNYNPGNIRHGDNWQGLSEEQTDKSFCQFKAMVWGCRALMKTLETYHNKYNIDTIEAICARWAPTNENDTESYIHSVARRMRLSPKTRLNLGKNKYLYKDLAKAIAYQENGKQALSISEKTWDEAYKLAFND